MVYEAWLVDQDVGFIQKNERSRVQGITFRVTNEWMIVDG